MSDPFEIAGAQLTSRVFLGTARYPSRAVLLDALAAAETEVVTVAIRRVGLATGAENLYEVLRERGYRLLPNTAGCHTARDAVLTARLAREALETDWVKLEVIADDETLLPEPEELLDATRTLVREGFRVLAYTNDDPVLARKLEDRGVAAVMPLAAPIGTGLGLLNPHALSMIRARTELPVIVDAGLGTASDVAAALELGCDGVLLNTAVARADDPVAMARAVGLAARAGRLAFHAGRIPKKDRAEPSSPLPGRIRTRDGD